MATKNFSGVLDAPIDGDFYEGLLRFTHLTTTGPVLAGSRSIEVAVVGGVYDFDLFYGEIVIESKVNTGNWYNHGSVIVNSETTATTLPALLLATTPATPELVQQLEAILSDAETAAADSLQYSTDSAQSAAEAAASAAVFDPANNPANINWDVIIPFNEGGEIERGYGNRDAFGNRAVDFSRASETGYIDKSGISDTTGVDEIAIEEDGAQLYQSYINEVSWSEDFGNASWLKNNISVSQDGTLAPDGVSQAWKITVLPGTSVLRQVISSSQIVVIGSFFVKGTIGETLKVDVRASDNSVVTQVEVTLTGKWQRVNSIDLGQNWLNQTDSSVSVSLRVDSVNTATEFYAWGALATKNLTFVAPYKKTEATAASRDADVCSMPARKNLPAQGDSFSIQLDTNATPHTVANKTLLRLGSSATSGINIVVDASGILFGLSDGSSFVFSDPHLFLGSDKKRVIADYDSDSGTIGLYIDGSLVGTRKAISNVTYDLSEDVYIGSLNGSSDYANCEVKNVKVTFSEGNLSPEQITALGAAE